MIHIENLPKSEQRLIEARRKYHREWRAKNKERVRRYNRQFYEKLADKKGGT